MLENDKHKQPGDLRLYRLAGGFHRSPSGESLAQDKAAELLRARLRGRFGSPEEKPKEAGHRSGQPGARGGAASEFEGSIGKLGPLR